MPIVGRWRWGRLPEPVRPPEVMPNLRGRFTPADPPAVVGANPLVCDDLNFTCVVTDNLDFAHIITDDLDAVVGGC